MYIVVIIVFQAIGVHRLALHFFKNTILQGSRTGRGHEDADAGHLIPVGVQPLA